MMNLLTYIFLFVRIFSNPVANMFQKILSKENSSVLINFYTYLILSICCIPFSFHYINTEILSTKFMILTFLAGFLCTSGVICLIKAINIGELSVIGPINSYKSIIGLISAFILLNEIPSIWALFGIFLIIFGSKFLFENTEEGISLALFKRKDIQLRLLALILTGIEAAILKKIILLSSVETCFIFWCFMGCFWSFVFLILMKKSFKLRNKGFINLCTIALCMGLMQYSTNYVFKYMNVGYALALFQLSSVVTVFIGWKIFKEQEFFKKLIGTLIMILGSVIIILLK